MTPFHISYAFIDKKGGSGFGRAIYQLDGQPTEQDLNEIEEWLREKDDKCANALILYFAPVANS